MEKYLIKPDDVRGESFIFVSYSRKDTDDLQEILGILKRNGFRVWYDKKIRANSEWAEVIGDKIDACEQFIVLISPNSIKSKYVRKEISMAIDRKEKISVIYLKETELSNGLYLLLNNIQSIHKELYRNEAEFERAICDAVSSNTATSDKLVEVINNNTVEPISYGFVPRDASYIERMQNILKEHHICILHGMSGSGKSELARQYAKVSAKKTIELTFPEQLIGAKYNLDKTLEEIYDGSSDEYRRSLFKKFLNNKNSLLIVHNFNTVDCVFLRYVMNNGADIIITTQCSPNEFLEKNILPEGSYVNLDIVDKMFLRNVFIEQYANNKQYALAHIDSVDRIIQNLFYNTMLIHLVSRQLAQSIEMEDLLSLDKDLEECKEDVSIVFEDTVPVTFVKDLNSSYVEDDNEKYSGENQPFEIVSQIMRRIFPDFTSIQIQILHLLALNPGEWSKSSDICYLIGDLPYDRKRKAEKAKRELQKEHVIQTDMSKGYEQISLHPLLKQIMFCRSELKESIIPNVSLGFWQNVERNAVINLYEIEKNKSTYKNEDGICELDLKFSFFTEMLIKQIVNMCVKQGMIKTSELCDQYKNIQNAYVTMKMTYPDFQIPSWISRWTLKRRYLNNAKNIVFSAFDNRYEYKKIIVYYEKGISILHEVTEDKGVGTSEERVFCIDINASQQLDYRYYNEDNLIQNGIPLFCAIDIVYKGEDESVVRIPDKIGEIPVRYVKFFDCISEKPKYQIVLPDTCKKFYGYSTQAISVKLNEGLAVYDFEGGNVERLKVPSTLQVVTERSVTRRLKNVEVDFNNIYFGEKDGVLFLKKIMRMIFIPPDKRRLTLSIPEGIESIDSKCMGYMSNEFQIEDMTMYQLEKLLDERDSLSECEKLLYSSCNEKSFGEVIERAFDILELYRCEKESIPCWLWFFMSKSNIVVVDSDTGISHELTMKEMESSILWGIMRRWISINQGDEHEFVDKMENFKETMNKLSYDKMKNVYDLLLSEDIRDIRKYIFRYPENFLRLFLVDNETIKESIANIKNKFGGNTLHTIMQCTDEDLVMSELFTGCGLT